MPPKEPGARSWHWRAYYSSPGSSPASQTCSTQGATSSGLWKAWAAEELGALRRPPEILYSIRNQLPLLLAFERSCWNGFSVCDRNVDKMQGCSLSKNPGEQLKMTPSVKRWLPHRHAHTHMTNECVQQSSPAVRPVNYNNDHVAKYAHGCNRCKDIMGVANCSDSI